MRSQVNYSNLFFFPSNIRRLENDASIWGDSSFCALLRTFRTIIIILLQPNIIPVWVPDSPSSITPIHFTKRSFEIWNRQEKGSKLSKNAYKLFSLATLKLFCATFFWKLRLFFQWDFPCGLSWKANYFYRLPNSQKNGQNDVYLLWTSLQSVFVDLDIASKKCV